MRVIEVALGFGSNLDDPAARVREAFERVGALDGVKLVACSSLYETPPWGVSEQPAFINACALIETALSPHALLSAVKRVEKDMGRAPAIRWGPRRIDIDILFYGNERVDDDQLTLPHRHLFDRAFVLVPLAEIAAQKVIDGRRVGDATISKLGIQRLPDEG